MYRFFLVILMVLLAGSVLAGDDIDQDRMKELELKIQELEKRIQSLQTPEGSHQELQELRRQMEVLAAEVEKLRSGEVPEEMTEQERRALGLGPSASRVYTRPQGVSLAGYGEMLYENFDSETDAGSFSGRFDQIDFLRAIVYFGYRFNDKILFNSEIEWEHASTGQGGEVSVEFAYIDYRFNENLTLRGGMILVPMGFVNELHEPTVFLGTRRPLTETVIIPTTWRENGAGIVGRAGMVDYRACVINGFNSAGFSSSGLRGGRQKGANAKIENAAFVGRVDISPMAGFLIGASLYTGNSGFFTTTFNPGLEIGTTVYEAHTEYKRHGLELRGLYAGVSLDNVTRLNEALNLTGNASVGESMSGGYLQAGYNLFAGRSSDMRLTPYIRFEKVNTQKEVPTGFSIHPAREQTIWTLGVEYRPIFNIVVKADYMAVKNEANTGVDQFNLALGYSF